MRRFPMTGWIKRSMGTALLLVLVAASTLLATSLIQHYFTEKGLQKEASKLADNQLESTRSRIYDVVDQAELAVRNNVWIASWCLDYPDSLSAVSWRIVQTNPVIVGSALALVPGYKASRPLFAPYVYREGQDSLHVKSLATESYDYPSHEWFRKPIDLDRGYWAEPYLDEGGGNILMTTYSVPVRDRKGNMAAVLTADISLDGLSDMIDSVQDYPHATTLILSRTGRFLANPRKELVMQQTVYEIAATFKDSATFRRLNYAMLSGETGSTRMKFMGKKCMVYYAPVDRLDWSMCLIIPESDIFSGHRRIMHIVRLFQLLGLLMLIVIIRSFVVGLQKYNDLEQKRERMQENLQIARNIQMSMVPKSLPIYAQRGDLDIAASILPAQEVGGDLYDFFLRENQLFFCIGDVSGKGIPASLVMAVTRTTFRSVAAREASPGTIVTTMNQALCEMNESNMFVTLFCGVLDLVSGRLRFCNAGHNPPFVLSEDISLLNVQPQVPLGVLSDYTYVEQETVFLYDDALFLYTDGLSEAENAAHEQFGEARIVEALISRKTSEAHLESVKSHVAAFVGTAPQSDDLTMLFIHYLGNEKPIPGDKMLILHNDIQQLRRLPDWLEAVLEKYGLDPLLAMSLNLALEEAVANVILYAYPKGTYGSVELKAELEGKCLRFILSDSGMAFDPTAAEDPDIAASATDRPIGGLGVFLVRQIMDSVSYRRENGKNYLTMTKNI